MNEKLITPDCKEFQYMGRIDDSNPMEPVWIYPCTCLKVRFTGTFVKAVITNIRSYWTNYIGVIVDGNESKVKLDNEGINTYTLADNLAQGEHELLLFKRMDSCHILKFHGLIVEEGAVISAPEALPQRRMEVYGDSVSAGEVSEAVAYVGLADPEHDGEYSNSYYSYSWLTARKLNATLHDIAQGGIALLDNTGYFNGPEMIGMEAVYDKLEYNPSLSEIKEWDFQKYTPHVVVVAIGQNDANPENYMASNYTGEKAAHWRNRYQAFIKTLRTKYPKATIILTTTILNHDPSWDCAIEDVCTRLKDSKVYHFTYSNNGCGTHGHIRIPEAEKMAEELGGFVLSLGNSVWED
ncbi:MAG: electron transporter RnfD [Lachnospiraceae bacterium]|nr:electron transporter RnfD [Lachnospiraceae bacterium]MBR3684570.1 electron transporter RnfD [Lachnospiraceae bacterium]